MPGYGDGAFGSGTFGGAMAPVTEPVTEGFGAAGFGDGGFGSAVTPPVTPPVTTPGAFGYDGFGEGSFGGAILTPPPHAEIPEFDRFGLGCYGRRYHLPEMVEIPDIIPDRFGWGCYGRRYRQPHIGPGDGYFTATSYVTVGRMGASGVQTYVREGIPEVLLATKHPRLRSPVVITLDEHRHAVSAIDGYESFEWIEKWREPDEFTLVANVHMNGVTDCGWATYIAVVMPWGETKVGLIEGRQLAIDGGLDTEMAVITGRDYSALLEGRIAKESVNTPGLAGFDSWKLTSTFQGCRAGSAAGAMAYYVSGTAITNPLTWRNLPLLRIGDIPATAANVRYNARFQTITQILSEIGVATGLGYRMRYDILKDCFYFDPMAGRDMTGSVAFSPTYGAVSAIGFAHSTVNDRNLVWIAGAGEAEDRIVLPYYDPKRYLTGNPQGMDLRELFVDAADIDEDSEDTLQSRAMQNLGEHGPDQTVEFTLLTGGPYQYHTDFLIGDVVLVEYPRWASAEARVIQVGQLWDRDGRTVSVVVGTEPADLKKVVVNLSRRQAIQGRR